MTSISTSRTWLPGWWRTALMFWRLCPKSSCCHLYRSPVRCGAIWLVHFISGSLWRLSCQPDLLTCTANVSKFLFFSLCGHTPQIRSSATHSGSLWRTSSGFAILCTHRLASEHSAESCCLQESWNSHSDESWTAMNAEAGFQAKVWIAWQLLLQFFAAPCVSLLQNYNFVQLTSCVWEMKEKRLRVAK